MQLSQFSSAPGAGEGHDPASPQISADLAVVLRGNTDPIRAIAKQKCTTRVIGVIGVIGVGCWGVEDERDMVLVLAALHHHALAMYWARPFQFQ